MNECKFNHDDPIYFTLVKCAHFDNITVEMYSDDIDMDGTLNYHVFAYRKVNGIFDASYYFGMDMGIPSLKVAEAAFYDECERMRTYEYVDENSSALSHADPSSIYRF